ncbi:MAG: hypothetical protein A4E55_01477 [Pelotomaculum sp. PtaU1.Bin035]|nr:MAG: hypothetical protein A4E55_01477 [Pelotomaculum sp. PtaU1.Bin035]
MKNSQQILGLPVLSIEEGKQIGVVKHLVLNAERGTVDFFLVEDDTWYLGLKVISFEDVHGIGEFGLTVTGQSSLSAVSESTGVLELLKKDLRLPGIKVLSKKGRLVGSISEYIIDENTAEIIGCQLVPAGNEKPAGIISKKFILTYGYDFLVVEEGVDDKLVADLQEDADKEEVFYDDNIKNNQNENIEDTAVDSTVTAVQNEPKVSKNEEQQVDPLKHFEEQQRKYLLGKKVTMRIVADNGEVVAEEGETITSDMIERARVADRYIQLTLNIRD